LQELRLYSGTMVQWSTMGVTLNAEHNFVLGWVRGGLLMFDLAKPQGSKCTT